MARNRTKAQRVRDRKAVMNSPDLKTTFQQVVFFIRTPAIPVLY